MARLAQNLVVEREALSFGMFKAGHSIKTVNDALVAKYSIKMATAKLSELKKAALAEVFASRGNPSNDNAVPTKADSELEAMDKLVYGPAVTVVEAGSELAMAYEEQAKLRLKNEEQASQIFDFNEQLNAVRKERAAYEKTNEDLSDELVEVTDTKDDLEDKVNDLEAAAAQFEQFDDFLFAIADRLGKPVDELKMAVAAGNNVGACKFIFGN